ncbi:MAG: hypothetical protein KJ915_01680 [Candidatus Omnitrophica bacterium]|nr:hypothetical protein [Candidatus Omnitrophota bacterium]
MVVVIYHNSLDYLKSVASLVEEQGFKAKQITEKKNIGTEIVGPSSSVTYLHGKAVPSYNKALVVHVSSEKEAMNFLSIIENDKLLNLCNLQDKGFISILPLCSFEGFNSLVASKG